jgi:hypothetical protein
MSLSRRQDKRHCEFFSVSAVGERISYACTFVFISVVTSRSSWWKRCVLAISDMERAYGFRVSESAGVAVGAAVHHCARSAHKVFPL